MTAYFLLKFINFKFDLSLDCRKNKEAYKNRFYVLKVFLLFLLSHYLLILINHYILNILAY